MTSYEVGSIVYLLNKDSLKIVPSIIKEEITKKTVNKVDIHYVLELPDKSRIEMIDIKETIFKDVNSLKEFMLENTRKSVERLIKNAIDVEKNVFQDARSENNSVTINESRVQNDIKSVIMNNEEANNTITEEEK
jgi:hypothetical protein